MHPPAPFDSCYSKESENLKLSFRHYQDRDLSRRPETVNKIRITVSNYFIVGESSGKTVNYSIPDGFDRKMAWWQGIETVFPVGDLSVKIPRQFILIHILVSTRQEMITALQSLTVDLDKRKNGWHVYIVTMRNTLEPSGKFGPICAELFVISKLANLLADIQSM